MKKLVISIFLSIVIFGVSAQCKCGGFSKFGFQPSVYAGVFAGPNMYIGDGFAETGFANNLGFSWNAFLGFNFTETISSRLIFALANKNWGGVPSLSIPAVNFTSHSVSAEIIYNLSNAFSYYNNNRLVDFSVFAGAGMISRQRFKSNSNVQNVAEHSGLVTRFGVQANFKLFPKMDIVAVSNVNFVDDSIDGNMLGGGVGMIPELKAGFIYYFK